MAVVCLWKVMGGTTTTNKNKSNDVISPESVILVHRISDAHDGFIKGLAWTRRESKDKGELTEFEETETTPSNGSPLNQMTIR